MRQKLLIAIAIMPWAYLREIPGSNLSRSESVPVKMHNNTTKKSMETPNLKPLSDYDVPELCLRFDWCGTVAD